MRSLELILDKKSRNTEGSQKRNKRQFAALRNAKWELEAFETLHTLLTALSSVQKLFP